MARSEISLSVTGQVKSFFAFCKRSFKEDVIVLCTDRSLSKENYEENKKLYAHGITEKNENLLFVFVYMQQVFDKTGYERIIFLN